MMLDGGVDDQDEVPLNPFAELESFNSRIGQEIASEIISTLRKKGAAFNGGDYWLHDLFGNHDSYFVALCKGGKAIEAYDTKLHDDIFSEVQEKEPSVKFTRDTTREIKTMIVSRSTKLREYAAGNDIDLKALVARAQASSAQVFSVVCGGGGAVLCGFCTQDRCVC